MDHESFNKLPVVDGMAEAPAEKAHSSVVELQRGIIGVRRAPKSIGHAVAELMYRTSNPPLAQTFILDAIEKFSQRAGEMTPEDVEEFDRSDMGKLIEGAAWRDIGAEISNKVHEFIDFVNGGGLAGASAAQIDKEIDTMEKQAPVTQHEVTQFIDTLKSRDWGKPLSPDEQAVQARVDPTGEITARFTPGQSH